MSEKLNELMRRCKFGVFVQINEHRVYRQDIESRLEGSDGLDAPDELDPAVRAKMIELDTMVSVQFYQHGPGGFDHVYHYDIDAALDKALEMTKEPA